MRVPTQRDRDELELKMTPMIDVVFLLLVFFLWTSSFEKPEFSMASALAEPPGTGGTKQADAPVEMFDEIIVRLAPAETGFTILMNDQPIDSIATLRLRLGEIAQIGVQPPVIVHPDDDIDMGDAIMVYDLARISGFDRVLFAAKP